MNILFAISFVRWGGVNTWMLELAEFLQTRGHHVFILAPKGHLMRKKAAEKKLGIVDRDFGPDFWTAPLWMSELKRRGIELVMTNTSKENRTVGAAARMLGLPVTQWVGLANDLKRNTATTRFERRWIVNRLIAECQSMRHEILARFPYIDPATLIYIRPGKPRRIPRASKSQLQHELGLRPDSLNAVICSQLTQGKGHAELFEAVARAKKELQDPGRAFHLSVFHTGKEAPKLAADISALGLSETITMRGFSERVIDYLPAFDVGFLPSHWEGLANNLREYMMAGLCPIVSDIPGNKEVVFHEMNGFIHKTGDPNDISIQIQRAISSPQLIEKLKNQAALDAEKFFGMEKSVTEMEDLFRQLTKKSR